MLTVSLAFALSLIAALVLTPAVRYAAQRLGALDVPGQNFRKAHHATVPRLGGLAIVVAFYAPLVGLLFVDSGVGHHFLKDQSAAAGLFLGALPIVALGVFDDLVGARASQKFLIQFGVAFGLWALGFRIEAVSTPFAGTLDLGLFALPITLLWIVGIVNAMNLIDGLDGLASGVALFAALTTLVVASVKGDIVMMLFMSALSGALIGFLVFNFNPASIFMGDTGSMFLGYIMSVTAIQTNTKGESVVALITPVLALGLPIMDTSLAFLRRAILAQPLFTGDNEHIHHRLLLRGLTERRAVVALYGVCILLGLMALVVTYAKGRDVVLTLLAGAFLSVLGMRYLGGFSRGTLREWARRRRENTHLWRTCRNFAVRARAAESPDAVLRALTRALSELEVRRARLHLTEKEFAALYDWAPDRGWLDSSAVKTSGEPLDDAVSHRLEGVSGHIELVWPQNPGDVAVRQALGAQRLAGICSDALVRVISSSAREPSRLGASMGRKSRSWPQHGQSRP